MKRKVSLILMLCLLAALVTGCENKNEKKPSNKTEHEVEVDAEITQDMEIFEQLFDLNNVISIQVIISEDELNKIQEDYLEYDAIHSKSPIYRMADKVIISIGDEVYELEEVGIRLKGNTSRVPVYDENTGKANLTHYRLSFNETFDDEIYYGEDVKVWESEEQRQERKDRRFATLESLEIKWNKNYDNTHVREIYAYDMFRDMGVLSQHVNLCSLGVNGENYGVVNIYETVDKEFIKKYLPEEDSTGDLYKCGWTYKPVNYVEDEVTYGIADKDEGLEFNYNLKTNKSKSAHESLKHLLETVNDENITKENFESVIDTEYLANFMAVSYFTGNPDDFRNNYNNHYLYFCGGSGKAIFIPYDYDRCLGITYSWNPEGTAMTWVSPFSDKSEASGRKQNNPIIKEAILDQGYILEEYKAALEKVRNSDWLTNEKFQGYYDIAKENYEELVTPTVDFENAYEDQFGFSLDGDSYQDGADYANMSYSQFINDILEYYDGEGN